MNIPAYLNRVRYMPVVQFCWGQDRHAAKILPQWLALEPRQASMYEICVSSAEKVPRIAEVLAAAGRPRLWLNARCASGSVTGTPRKLAIPRPWYVSVSGGELRLESCRGFISSAGRSQSRQRGKRI